MPDLQAADSPLGDKLKHGRSTDAQQLRSFFDVVDQLVSNTHCVTGHFFTPFEVGRLVRLIGCHRTHLWSSCTSYLGSGFGGCLRALRGVGCCGEAVGEPHGVDAFLGSA